MDLERFLDAGGMAVIGVIVGAFLTYLFGALNRRHQEARENDTRWYGERFKVYAEVARAYSRANYLMGSPEFKEAVWGLAAAVGPILFVGSPEAKKSAVRLLRTLRESGGERTEELGDAWKAFEDAARDDLGH